MKTVKDFPVSEIIKVRDTVIKETLKYPDPTPEMDAVEQARLISAQAYVALCKSVAHELGNHLIISNVYNSEDPQRPIGFNPGRFNIDQLMMAYLVIYGHYYTIKHIVKLDHYWCFVLSQWNNMLQDYIISKYPNKKPQLLQIQSLIKKQGEQNRNEILKQYKSN